MRHIALLSLSLSMLSGCTYSYRNMHKRVGLYGLDSPVQNQLDLTGADLSGLAAMKVGRACQDLFLNLVPIGDETASLAAAITKGGITQVKLVETEVHWALPTSEQCVVAYGL